MTATEKYYAHKTACILCLKGIAPTESGLCSYGFRAFLDFSGEVWRRRSDRLAPEE